MTLRKLLIRRNENKNLIFKLQTSFVFLFYGKRKRGFRKFRKSVLSILIFFGCAFVPYLKIFAQENFTGCDKSEEKKDLPFPIDRIKQMCKKDLNNKKEGWYPTGLPLVNSDPNSGIFLEVTYEKASKTIVSDFDFQKYFGHAKFFYNPFPKAFEKLVLASRFGFGVSDGNVPFFEYRNLWGTENTVSGLGGLRTLRGYKQDRFVGRVMGFGTVEARWKFHDFSVGGEYFALNIVPFWDFGRVWDDEYEVGLSNYKYSRGLGLRIAWNQATIIMMDYAVSREDEQLFVNFNHTF
ncbi:outer membrane protein assembly factor [Leptospira borgpetersenii]|nr:DUF5982 domain-containing protein [Leptospira borgpetersenii]URD71393.1 outer membrane protein assembly factor [Leptospira borgpetersenii]